MSSNNSESPLVLKYFLLLFGFTIIMVGKLLWPFISTLILSLLLVNIFRPIYKFISRYTSNSLGALLTCGLIILLVFVPLTFFVGALSQEALAYLEYIKEINFSLKTKELIQGSSFFASLQEHLQNFGVSLQTDDLGRTIADYSSTVALYLYKKSSAWAANILNFMVDFALMVLIIFFLLTDYERLGDFLLRLSPLPDQQERQLIVKFQQIAQAVLIGNGICGLIQGVLGGLLFAYLEIGSPVLWGGVMGVLAFLPIVGIGVVLLPTAFIFFLQGQIGTAVFIAVYYFILSMTIEYLLKPILVGSKVKMHTLVVFLSIIGGLSLFGVLGIIYGPLIITAFLTMSDIYLKNYAQFVKKDQQPGGPATE